ncbi:hypothetical protein INR49_011531 [Caranx melampygus]|nr:hypothetical protein INR49_011531 [Caranx melampygus]
MAAPPPPVKPHPSSLATPPCFLLKEQNRLTVGDRTFLSELFSTTDKQETSEAAAVLVQSGNSTSVAMATVGLKRRRSERVKEGVEEELEDLAFSVKLGLCFCTQRLDDTDVDRCVIPGVNQPIRASAAETVKEAVETRPLTFPPLRCVTRLLDWVLKSDGFWPCVGEAGLRDELCVWMSASSLQRMLVPLIIQFFVVCHENDGSGFQWDGASKIGATCSCEDLSRFVYLISLEEVAASVQTLKQNRLRNKLGTIGHVTSIKVKTASIFNLASAAPALKHL